jgi:hypothetical protein
MTFHIPFIWIRVSPGFDLLGIIYLRSLDVAI